MIKIGLSGGIGSGKSLISKVFSCLHVPVFVADDVARKISDTDPVVKEAVKNTFGTQSYRGAFLNRPYIADIVFSDKQKLEELNAIIHPAVRRAFDRWCTTHAQAPYLLYEAAILYETGNHQHMQHTILVDAPEALRIERVIKRDKTTEKAVRQRMLNQWPAEKKRALADWVIENDGKSLILPSILEIHQHLLDSAHG